MARSIKAKVAVAVQTSILEPTKVYVPSIPQTKLPKNNMARVLRDLPHATTKAGVQHLTEIMIQLILINLVTTESVMVTFAK